MKKVILPLFGFLFLYISGCCKKCELSFDDAELVHVNYDLDGGNQRTFENSKGEQIVVKLGNLDVQNNGKTCGGFGSPDDNFCSINAVRQFMTSGNIDDLEVTLTKSNEVGFDDQLRVEIHMGKTNIYVLFDGQTVSQSTLNELELFTINGTTYNDVLSYFFNPNDDCKNPGSSICVEANEVVAVKFSLSAGLLQFELHKGLQEPNEVYTAVA